MSPSLDPEAQVLLEVMRAAATAQPYTLPVEDAREQMRGALIAKGEPIAVRHVEDVALPTPHGPLAMRLYRPADVALPIALFVHGGGWILNDLDTHDRLCRRIARRSGCLVASLDYRRAPEHKHPAALEDALFAYRWLVDNAQSIGGDASRIALFGESSGGATVACLTILLRDLGAAQPVLQIIAYPITDAGERWLSYEEHGEGYTLDRQFVRWSLENCLPAGQDAIDPYFLPMACENLSGLAPSLVVTAEFDPLRDQGIAYARRLSAAGVAVEHLHVQDQPHGFLLLDRAVARAGVLIDRLADSLAAQCLHTPRMNSAL